jgi:hypothetical protein
MQLMKNNMKQILFALVLSISVLACKPEPRELGPRANQSEGINGTWVLTKIDQIDVNVELAFQESDTLLDVTQAMLTSAPMEISFDKTSKNFEITSGAGSEFFGNTMGSWEFDNDDYPSYLQLNNPFGPQIYSLIRPVRPQDAYLAIKYNKMCGSDRTVSYHLWFVRK